MAFYGAYRKRAAEEGQLLAPRLFAVAAGHVVDRPRNLAAGRGIRGDADGRPPSLQSDLPSEPSPILSYPASNPSAARRPALGRARRRALRRRASSIEELHEGRDIDDPGVPLGVRLFAADGVTWVVSMPTGLANDTMWPDMDWIEALATIPSDAEEMEEVCAA